MMSANTFSRSSTELMKSDANTPADRTWRFLCVSKQGVLCMHHSMRSTPAKQAEH